jgi:hypothetical protein
MKGQLPAGSTDLLRNYFFQVYRNWHNISANKGR